MRRSFLVPALITVALGGTQTISAEPAKYGGGVELEESTSIAALLADPDAYLGKTVRVEGGVLDVCPRKGCWIEIGEAEQNIQIKVDDGVIVFPTSARGKIAAAQGVVEAIEMTREKYIGWLAHVAEEKGEPFDAATAEVGDGPYRIIRIRGTGAEID